jgi:hypothetical protein
MTEADVAELVGEPDGAETVKHLLIHSYHIADPDRWVITFKDGLVIFSGSPREPDPNSATEFQGPVEIDNQPIKAR